MYLSEATTSRLRIAIEHNHGVLSHYAYMLMGLFCLITLVLMLYQGSELEDYVKFVFKISICVFLIKNFPDLYRLLDRYQKQKQI
jgi:hypothetical protein